MAKKIVYLIPGLHFPSGMERVLTLKANYLADEFGYDVTVILKSRSIIHFRRRSKRSISI